MKTALILVALAAWAPVSAVRAQTGLDDAQRLFYNGRYEAAELLTVQLCSADLEGLEGCELRSSTLLFQIKRAVSGQPDKQKAFTACAACAGWMSEFRAVTASAQTLARARLQLVPADEATRFLLGKIDLNYVWLQLGVLGRKTGWSEYWEARKSLDAVL